MSLSATLIVIGIAFLVVAFWAFAKVLPKDGQPRSWWTATELRSSVTAMTLLCMMIAGVGFVIKGLIL